MSDDNDLRRELDEAERLLREPPPVENAAAARARALGRDRKMRKWVKEVEQLLLRDGGSR